jgi:hypothetical protein
LLSNHRKEKAAGELLVLRWHNTTCIRWKREKEVWKEKHTTRANRRKENLCERIRERNSRVALRFLESESDFASPSSSLCFHFHFLFVLPFT